jgi:hypothetical protein
LQQRLQIAGICDEKFSWLAPSKAKIRWQTLFQSGLNSAILFWRDSHS